LLTPDSKRYDVVLTFVSMLEMIRQKSISVKQNINFGEIVLGLIDREKDGDLEEPEEGEVVS
jgi:chromatin segregation and condensation protein Rec8/ScpA/Scc1 (kleisin family)